MRASSSGVLATRSRAASVAIVLAALGVAAIAARSYRPFASSEASTTGRAPSSTFVDTSFTLALCLIVGLALIALYVLPSLRGTRKRKGNASMHGLIAYLTFIVVAVAIGQHVVRRPFQIGKKQDSGEATFPGQPQHHATPAAGHTRSPEIVWPVAIVAALLAAGLVVALIVSSRRRTRVVRDDTGSPDQLAAALDDAIDDLRHEPDPRKAVVAAYARMESALALFGLPRRSAEAPYEYLGRTGRELRAETSMASLTESFEEAKFSEHPIGEDMREQAIAALTAIRNDVRLAA